MSDLKVGPPKAKSRSLARQKAAGLGMTNFLSPEESDRAVISAIDLAAR